MTPAQTTSRTLAAQRAELDHVDGEIVALVARRVALARAIGARKREAGLATLDTSREAAVVGRAAAMARAAELAEEPVRTIFWQLVELCRRAQEVG